MARAKRYQDKGENDTERRTRAVIDPEVEFYEEEKKQQKKLSNNKNWIEIDRRIFIGHLLEASDVIDKQINRHSEDDKTFDLSTGKNILQSLVYLILNPIFYNEILKIRKKLKIPKHGFMNNSDFDNYVAVFDEAEWLIGKYGLANKHDISSLSTILGYFITQRLDFNGFMEKIVDKIYKNRNEVLIRGVNVKVKELPVSERYFYKCQWTVTLYPFGKTTEIGNIVKDFFEKELIHEKNKESYDKQWVEKQMSRLHISKKVNEEKPILEIMDGTYTIVLRFNTDFFTKPSQIISLYNERKDEIIGLLHKKEERLKKIQEKRLSKNFSRNYSIYRMYREGILHDEIYDEIFGERDIPGSESLNTPKGEIGKFQTKIRDSIKRKIVF